MLNCVKQLRSQIGLFSNNREHEETLKLLRVGNRSVFDRVFPPSYKEDISGQRSAVGKEAQTNSHRFACHNCISKTLYTQIPSPAGEICVETFLAIRLNVWYPNLYRKW